MLINSSVAYPPKLSYPFTHTLSFTHLPIPPTHPPPLTHPPTHTPFPTHTSSPHSHILLCTHPPTNTPSPIHTSSHLHTLPTHPPTYTPSPHILSHSHILPLTHPTHTSSYPHTLLHSHILTGEDYSEWFHHPWVPGGVDTSRQVRGYGVGSGGGAQSWQGRPAGACGLLLRKSLHQVMISCK